MLTAWREDVGDDETIVCLGDVTVDGQAHRPHHYLWNDNPGTRWLVLSNHDVDPVNALYQFTTSHRATAIYADGDPPLLLTHVPLREVP